MGRRRRAPWLGAALALGSLVVSAGAGAVALAAAPAGADPISDCTTTTGVVVVVDFSHWGGSIMRGCDGTLTTGLDALARAGFTTAGDTQDGSAFVCRIDNEPGPATEPCTSTPPASASWSYWHADVGQTSWSYSTQGAASYQPPPGSVDAWTFGVAGTPSYPSFTPAQVRATTVGPTSPTTTPTTAAGGGSIGGGGGGGASTPAGGSSTPVGASGGSGSSAAPGVAPAQAPSSSASPGAGTPSATAPAGGSSVPTTTPPKGSDPPPTKTTAHTPASGGRSPSPRIVDVTPAAVRSVNPGSPVPLVVGSLVAAALAAAAVVVARRRRGTA